MCTGIKIKPEDGSVIFARTLEFGLDCGTGIAGVPAGMELTGSAPENKPGQKWTSKYPVIGMNMLNGMWIQDGLNSEGLNMGCFNFTEYTQYQSLTPSDYDKCLNAFEVPVYVLSTSATIDEAIAALRQVKVAHIEIKQYYNTKQQLHWRLSDKSGRTVAIEYLDGELKVIKNPLGVMTNSPNFTWHLTNLTNYVNMSPYAWPAVEIENLTLKPSSLGSGMNGLPGDFTSPSRFVRAVAFQETHTPSATADDGVKTAFHILNLFDIPKGASVQRAGGVDYADITQMTVVVDLTNLRYFFRTFENSQIRMISMADFLAGNHSEPVQFDRSGEDVFKNVTGTAKPLG
jgi:choloylglycine hydrolase